MKLRANKPGRIPSDTAKLCTGLPKIIAFWLIAFAQSDCLPGFAQKANLTTG